MASTKLIDLKVAHDAGERFAKNLCPGLVFLGAGPAAQINGYIPGTAEYRMFLGAALDIMDSMVILTDKTKKIVSVERKG